MKNRAQLRSSVRTGERLVMFGLVATLFVGCATAPEITDKPPAAAAEGGIQAEETMTVQESMILGEWTVDAGEFVVGRHGGSIRLELHEMPTTFNPAMYLGLYGDMQVLPMLFSPLLDVHQDLGILRGNLAESFALSVDGRSVDMTLREGLTWSDGVPLTADDVVYSYNQLYLNPDVGGIGVEIAERVGGLSVIRSGDRSVQISCGISSHELLIVLGYQPLPRHIVEPWLEGRDPAEFMDFWAFYDDLTGHVGSGPFNLVSFTEAESFDVGGVTHTLTVSQLERNPHYHLTDAVGNQLPYLDTVTLLAWDDVFGPGTLYWDGLVDVTYLPTWAPDGARLGNWPVNTGSLGREAALAIPGQHYLVADTATYVTTFVTFNMQRAPGPEDGGLDPPMADWFNDVRFRRAISHLVPRDRIIEELHGGDAVPAYGRIVEGTPNYTAAAESLIPRSDPEAGAALLTEMGLIDRDGDGIREGADGTPVSIVMGTNGGNAYRVDLLELLVDEFREAGIDVIPEPAEYGPLVQKLLGGTYQAVLLGTTVSNTVADDWDIWASGRETHFWDMGQAAPQREWEAQLDELYEEWKVTVGRERLLEIEREVQRILAEQLPLISVTRGYDYMLMRHQYRNLRLVGPHRRLWPLAYIFLDE